MDRLIVPQGEFQLARYPQRKKDPLRAWDAADEYLLHQLHEDNLLVGAPSVLILNDNFGALAVALSAFRPQLVSDSYLAHRGALANLRQNGKAIEHVQLLDSLDYPELKFGLVLIKVPKSLAFLEDQLCRLGPCLQQSTQIIAAGMVRGIHTSTLNLFERIIGPPRTSLAKKKARLIFCRPEIENTSAQSPFPRSYTFEQMLLLNHANVFSWEKLDIGTRFFIRHINHSTGPQRIVDLGCGNGIIGLVAARQNPQAELVFTDASFMAIASAKANFQAAFGPDRKAEFHTTDCLQGIADQSIDQVLCNPPFHQERAISKAITWQMLRESKAALKKGGSFQLVGSQHLEYHTILNRVFGNFKVVASNPKFVVLSAVKR